LTLWLLGYPDQAQQRLQEAFTLAQALEHPFSLVNVQVLAAQLYHCRREGAQVAAQAEAAVALAQVQGFRQREVEGAILWGWALAAQGRGAGQIRQEVETWQTTGAGRVRPYWQAVLADTSSLLGQVAEALTLVAEALEGTGPGKRQHFYVAELYRLQGELVLQSSVEQSGVQTLDSRLGALDAETCFQQALEIARQQQAKALELRAATSLSRLWQRQGERAAAHALLAPIYGWFTEGFDTADLQEAQALLAELA
jgi:predicted ATPase